MFNSEVNFKQVILSPIIILGYFIVMYYIGEEEAICLFKSDIWTIITLLGTCMVLCPWVCFTQNIKTSLTITYIGVLLVVFGIGIRIVGWGWALIHISILMIYMNMVIDYGSIAKTFIVGLLIFGIANRNVEVTPEKILPPSEELYKDEPNIEWFFNIIDNHGGYGTPIQYTFTGTRDQLRACMEKTLAEKIKTNSNIGVVTFSLGDYGICGVPKDVALKYGDIVWARDEKYRHFK